MRRGQVDSILHTPLHGEHNSNLILHELMLLHEQALLVSDEVAVWWVIVDYMHSSMSCILHGGFDERSNGCNGL